MISVRPVSVHDADAVRLLRAYFTELVARYHDRPALVAEVDAAQAEDPSDDLVPPGAVFLLAGDATEAVGCVGLRRLGADIAELTRMFVLPAARGRGVGRLLLAAADRAAGEWGVRAIRLDTRHDLVEARALYAGHGYREIPPYNDGRYAEHWFEKPVAAAC